MYFASSYPTATRFRRIGTRPTKTLPSSAVRCGSARATNSTQPGMIADELRRQADEFIDLIHLAPKVGRDPAERQQRFGDRRPAPGADAVPGVA